jgi:dihydropteroate synthase
MSRRHTWKLKQRELLLGDRTWIMGVLNVTPDSFSDGGRYADPDRAFARAIELEDQGADILDIGAESTRPGSARISEAEELRRLVPVLKRLKGNIRIPISIDTYKAAVAEKALEHGAEIINDPSGLILDPLLPKVVAKWDAGLVINHMRGTPETWPKLPPLKDAMRTVYAELEAATHRAQRSGVQKYQIAIDPGIGFGKRREQDVEIIAKLSHLRALDFPIVAGPSRKSFLKQDDAATTEFATAGAVAGCAFNGAHIVRVHDVKAMKAVLDVVDNIWRSAEEE